MAQNTNFVPANCNGQGRVVLAGRWLSGTHNNDYASYVLPVTAAGADLMVYSKNKGTGLGYKFTSVADGSAYAGIVAPTPNIDSTVSFAAVGTPGNLASLCIVPIDCGGLVAGGGYIYEDTTALSEKLVVVVNINTGNECTVTQFNALVGGSTNFTATGGTGSNTCDATDVLAPTLLAGGTQQEYGTWSVDTLTLHFTDAASTAGDCITMLNQVTGSQLTAAAVGSATTTNVLAATADEVTDQPLIGGETICTGKGFVVTHTGVATYNVAPNDPFVTCVNFEAKEMEATASVVRALPLLMDPANKSFTLTTLSGATPTELADGDYLQTYLVLTQETR